MVETAFKLGEVMAGARSSTAQDIHRGKITEIDSLNGYVVRKGAEFGIATPVNYTLWALIKLLEQSARVE
jgi:2-dehydropantoate 2-reductase